VEARVEIGHARIAIQNLGRLVAGRCVLSRLAEEDFDDAPGGEPVGQDGSRRAATNDNEVVHAWRFPLFLSWEGSAAPSLCHFSLLLAEGRWSSWTQRHTVNFLVSFEVGLVSKSGLHKAFGAKRSVVGPAGLTRVKDIKDLRGHETSRSLDVSRYVSQAAVSARVAFKPIEGSVYVGRARVGKLVQIEQKKFRAFDASDLPLGEFRVRARALASIRKSARDLLQ
jgi:hypothetical protein